MQDEDYGARDLSQLRSKRIPKYNVLIEPTAIFIRLVGLQKEIIETNMSGRFSEDFRSRTMQHFVGSFTCSLFSLLTSRIGTEEVGYKEMDWAGAEESSAGLAFEQKLSISVSRIVGLSGNIIRGNRDKPEFVSQSSYSLQIENARKIHVVLYDNAVQRGWLVDGASALLHLVRTQVVTDSFMHANSLFKPSNFDHSRIDAGPSAAAETLRKESNMKHVIFREFVSFAEEQTATFQSEGENASMERVSDESEHKKAIYQTTCFRELVSRAWSVLEHIYDRQIDFTKNHTSFEIGDFLGSYPSLLGFEFMDIASGEKLLTPRTVKLQWNGAAWVDFTRRIHAVTLFGRNFGEIYKPSENIERLICKKWKSVPEGHDLLAIPVSILKEIREQSRRKGQIKDSSEIAKGVHWTASASGRAFNTCGDNCKHLNRVQRFRTRKDTVDMGSLPINGAFLIGKSSILDVGTPDSPQAPTQDQSNISGGGIEDTVLAASQTSIATTRSPSRSLIEVQVQSTDTSSSAEPNRVQTERIDESSMSRSDNLSEQVPSQ